jgi:hypothetical protein
VSSHEEAGYAKKRPISTHKAFAPIVALWFAALLGLGSLVLPVAQIERLVLMTGIANYLPMIAPPLDFAGRAIVAAVLALLGGAIGQVIASRLGNAHSGYATEDTDGEARAPISAYQELGDAEAEEEAPRRSRRLAIEDGAQEEEVIEFAPLPLAMMSEADAGDDEAAEEVSFVPEPDEMEMAEPEAIEDDDQITVEEEIAGEDVPVIGASYPSEPVFDAVEPESEPEPEPEPEAEAELEPKPEPEYENIPFVAEPSPEVVMVEVKEQQVAPVASPCQKRPLEELGLVQLVERLGASMQKHRSMGASLAEAPAISPAPQPFAEPVAPLAHDKEVVGAQAEETTEVEASAVETPESASEPVTAEDVVEVDQPSPAEPVPVLDEGPEFEPAAEEEAVKAELETLTHDVPADESAPETEPEAPVEEEVIESAPEESVEQAEPEPELTVEEVAVEAENEAISEEDTTDEPEHQVELANPFSQFASFAEHEDEDEEELASLEDSFRLPIGNNTAPQEEVEDDNGPDIVAPSEFGEDASEDEEDYEEEREEDDGGEEVYGSLLSLRRPFPRAPFGESEGEDEAEGAEPEVEASTDMLSQPAADHAEEQEQVAGPPAAHADDLNTEAHQRALRDALLSLQKLDRAG